MRVISGYFKGKKLLGPKDVKTRPLKDLTKESIFNIIDHSNKFKVKLFEAKDRMYIKRCKKSDILRKLSSCLVSFKKEFN